VYNRFNRLGAAAEFWHQMFETVAVSPALPEQAALDSTPLGRAGFSIQAAECGGGERGGLSPKHPRQARPLR